jgi:hypothetical protein
MDAIVIERGIPAPNRVGPNSLIAILRNLRVGESVLVPGKTAKQMSSYIRPAKRGTCKFFESKTMTTGARVWRLE